MLKDTDAAWLAGYIDGDGTIGLYRKTRTGNRQAALCIDSADLELLNNVIRLVGGSLVKKKKYAAHHRQSWTWRMYGSQNIRGVLAQVLPHLRCAFKKERARMLVEEWTSTRNGVYGRDDAVLKRDFEERFLALGEGRGKRASLKGVHQTIEHMTSHPRPPAYLGKQMQA